MTFMHKLSRRLAMMKARVVLAAAATCAVAVGFACELPIRTAPNGATLAFLVLSPKTVTLQENQPASFMAVGLTAAGDTVRGSIAVSWSVTGGSILDTSSSNGRHYGHYQATVPPGQVKVRAVAQPGGQSDSASVTVIPAPVASVSVTPPSASTSVGLTVQLTATPKDANGNPLSGRVITWASNNTAVATVSGNGLVTAVASGSATITATSEGQSGTAAVTVSSVPVASVTVTPSPASVQQGATVQLTATPKDANGNPLSGRVVTWASNNTAVATVNGSGLVTGVAGGSATITATSEGQSGTAAVTVSSVPVATVTVTPSPASVQQGATVQLTATPKDANGNPLSGRVVTWASNNTAVATVNGSGLVTGVAAGTATITATSESKSGTSSITVASVPVASVTVTPALATLPVAQTLQLIATPKDANGNALTGRTVTWSSSNPSAATVNGSGLVTGVAAGLSTVTATSEGQSGTAAITVQASSGPLPVFPGAQGFGTTTPAGRGGAILRVTNLNDAGPGSLRQALSTTGPRTIIFEISGTIRASGDLYITDPFVTVAGQTAPSPGITISGGGMHIQTHDVLIQHVRVRVGDAVAPSGHGDLNGVMIENSSATLYNIVIDHVSASWSLDRNVATWYQHHDITFSHDLISEGLAAGNSGQNGFLAGDHGTSIALIGNVFAHNYLRNPYFKGDTYYLMVNNVVYNWGSIGTYLDDPDGSGLQAETLIGNVYIPGPSTPGGLPMHIYPNVKSGSQVYVADNTMNRAASPADPWSLVINDVGAWVKASSPPVMASALTILPSTLVEASVLAQVGARPADRDNVDIRVVNDVKNGTGRVINSQNDVGGWPVLAVNVRPLTVPANPNGDSGNGYTNLEIWLQQFAAQVEGR